MGKSVVSWSEKYDIANAKGHEIKPVRKDMMGMKAGQKMLIATPKMVADIIATIPHGQIKDTSFCVRNWQCRQMSMLSAH